MGAWIEIADWQKFRLNLYVAPFMGAWIEILFTTSNFCTANVAPFMGAWIEITDSNKNDLPSWSHLLWVRGLKS